MAITHPDARLVRSRTEHSFVKLQGICKLTDPAIGSGLQIEVAGALGLFGGNLIELRNRLFRTVLAVQDQGQVSARGGERGRQLKRAAQQVLRILVAPDPPGELSKQADRGDVERKFLELRAQQRLGARHVICVHRQGRFDQPRMILAEPGEPGLRGDGCHSIAT